MSAHLLARHSSALSNDMALRMLKSSDTAKISEAMPHKPVASEVYLYQPSKDDDTEGDWAVDGWRWIHDGTDRLPRKCPVVYKRKFRAWTADGKGSLGFRKLVFSMLDDSEHEQRKLIQYLGSEAEAGAGPHGNAKEEKNYVRTKPSAAQKLHKLFEENPSAAPNVVYKNEVGGTDCGAAGMSNLPRNRKQVENIKAKVMEDRRLSKDTLANLLDIAHDMPDFVWKVIVVPDLAVVCGRQQLLDEMDRVLTLDSCEGQLLSYDTTFQCGDFYVSAFLFRHVLFKNNPCIPAAFLIHERKFTETHEELIMTLTKNVKALSTSKAAIVTDREFGIGNALSLRAPQVKNLLCWVHVIRDLQLWIKKHGGGSVDCSVYTDHLKKLLHCADKANYEERLQEFKPGWSKAYREYYEGSIEPLVGTQLGRWVVEPFGVYNGFSGVTQNQAESFNALLKRFQGWKEASVDMFCLSMFKLQGYYINEIRRGVNGLGEYTLKTEFQTLEGTYDEPLLLTESPEEIVQKMKERCMEHPPSPAKEYESVSSDNFESSMPQTASPSRVLAADVTARGDVQFDPRMKVFLVKGTTEVRIVKLFPKPSCSCGSVRACYHVRAVQQFLGISENRSGKRKVSLSALRGKRQRGKAKSGRKVPRLGDCDVGDAPDSEAVNQSAAPAEKTAPVEGSGDEVEVMVNHGKSKQLEFRPPDSDICAAVRLVFGIEHGQRPKYGPDAKASFNEPPKRVKKIYGDGNCLFRAVGFAFSGSQDHHVTVRDTLMENIKGDMKERLEMYIGGPFDQHKNRNRMEKDGSWGTDVELVATALLTGCDVYVYHAPLGENKQPLPAVWLRYGACRGGEGNPGIYLDNTGREHFDCVLEI